MQPNTRVTWHPGTAGSEPMFCALIVDDHAGFRGSLSGLLRKRFPDIRVEEAADGAEVRRAIGSLAVQLVLMDVSLPGESGIELTRVIKTSVEDVTIVILTGHDLPQYRQAAFRNGADCFLYKGSPSCTADVVARVEGARRAYETMH